MAPTSRLGASSARKAYARYFREFTVESKPLRLDAIFAKADSAESSQCLTVRPGHVFDWVIQLSCDHDGRLIPAGTPRIGLRLLPDDSR
jgi:hypothetical protein